MANSKLSDTGLMESRNRALLKLSGNLRSIMAELSDVEQCSMVFLVLNKQELTANGFILCQYCISGKDISDNLLASCGEASKFVSALYYMCRYDLLEKYLGLCLDHSLKHVCNSLTGIESDRLTLYRIFAALPQHVADSLLDNHLSHWLRSCTQRPLEETFCRNLSQEGVTYARLLSELHVALCSFPSINPNLAASLSTYVTGGHAAGTMEKLYPLPRDFPHGLCVLINVNSFIEPMNPADECNLPQRRGSDIDMMRLEATFLLFGFQIFKLLDPDAVTIGRFFANLKSDVRLAHIACLAVVIMTHGDADDNLFLHDRRVLALHDLRRLCFSPFFINKPRLLFVQACRGEAGLAPMFVQHDGVQALNREGDCLINCATVRGYAAMRSQSSGSWYISDLCAALQQLGHTERLHTVLQYARESLAARVEQLGHQFVTQISEDVSTLVKNVQLVRGPEEQFANGCQILLLVQILDDLIAEAVDAFCDQFESKQSTE